MDTCDNNQNDVYLEKFSRSSEYLQLRYQDLSHSIQLLCDSFCHVQAENSRIKMVVSETLDSADKSNKEYMKTCSGAYSTPIECQKCVANATLLAQLRQEKEQLEFMKPYTEELLKKNDIAMTRIKVLEKELSLEKKSVADQSREYRECVSKAQLLSHNVTLLEQVQQNLQQHYKQIVSAVYELEVRNSELSVINQHQQCIIKDNMDTISLLRKEMSTSLENN